MKRANVGFARRLRKDATDAERRLWGELRRRKLAGYRFRRQHQIGPYIADFCCVGGRVVVELDGGQHAANAAADEVRQSYLAECGYHVLRFWNHEVLLNTQGVLDTIFSAVSSPSPQSSPRRGEEGGAE